MGPTKDLNINKIFKFQKYSNFNNMLFWHILSPYFRSWRLIFEVRCGKCKTTSLVVKSIWFFFWVWVRNTNLKIPLALTKKSWKKKFLNIFFSIIIFGKENGPGNYRKNFLLTLIYVGLKMLKSSISIHIDCYL